MGDPKKIRKKYQTPTHPWQKARIDEEKALLKEYGFKNKREIWRMFSALKKFKQRLKRCTGSRTKQAEKEKQQLLKKLQNLGLTKGVATEDEILGLTIKDVLERRLQTLVFRKGMANSMRQARQMITHKHIVVNERKISAPSYLVKKDEEQSIGFAVMSGFANPNHPERTAFSKNG